VNHVETRETTRGGRLSMPRTRGAASGLLLVLLGAWGASAPFIGPELGFAYSGDRAWTAARGWLEVLPGIVAVIGGGLLLMSRNRVTAILGGWLAVLAGAWFVTGRAAAGPLGLGDVGAPVAPTDTQRLLLELSYFTGLGALVVFLGGVALGRVSVRTARDLEYARRVAVVEPEPAADPVEADADERPTAPTRHRAQWRGRRWVGALRDTRTPAGSAH
jgi:hypothetical protein